MATGSGATRIPTHASWTPSSALLAPLSKQRSKGFRESSAKPLPGVSNVRPSVLPVSASTSSAGFESAHIDHEALSIRHLPVVRALRQASTRRASAPVFGEVPLSCEVPRLALRPLDGIGPRPQTPMVLVQQAPFLSAVVTILYSHRPTRVCNEGNV
jgi:hypothetical protein